MVVFYLKACVLHESFIPFMSHYMFEMMGSLIQTPYNRQVCIIDRFVLHFLLFLNFITLWELLLQRLPMMSVFSIFTYNYPDLISPNMSLFLCVTDFLVSRRSNKAKVSQSHIFEHSFPRCFKKFEATNMFMGR